MFAAVKKERRGAFAWPVAGTSEVMNRACPEG